MKNSSLSKIFVVAFLFLLNPIFGSFPVKSPSKAHDKNEQTIINSQNGSVFEDTKIETLKSNLESSPLTDSTKSKNDLVILLVLWFFLGFLAAHRWYAKKPAGWNILFILTFGGLGIWAIIDLISILTGKF